MFFSSAPAADNMIFPVFKPVVSGLKRTQMRLSLIIPETGLMSAPGYQLLLSVLISNSAGAKTVTSSDPKSVASNVKLTAAEWEPTIIFPKSGIEVTSGRIVGSGTENVASNLKLSTATPLSEPAASIFFHSMVSVALFAIVRLVKLATLLLRVGVPPVVGKFPDNDVAAEAGNPVTVTAIPALLPPPSRHPSKSYEILSPVMTVPVVFLKVTL